MRSAVAIVLICAASMSAAQSTTWPPLPKEGFTSGRAATKADVEAGRAVFVAAKDGVAIGKPLPLEIPQYAYFIDKGKRTPAIIVQGEEARGSKLLGARLLSGTFVAGLSTDFELLGKEVPKRAP
jgi:hypothetical protein